MGPIRRQPLRYTIIALAIGIALIAGKAWVGELEGWGWDAVADVLGVFGGVALAAAGVNEVVLRLTAGDWTRRTAPAIAPRRQNVLDEVRAIVHAAAVTAAVTQPLRETLDYALVLPRSDDARSVLRELASALRETETRAKHNDAVASAVVAAARGAYAEAVSAAGRCLAALQAIGMLRPDWALELETVGVALESATRNVDAPARAGRSGAHVAAMNVGVLFHAEQVLDVLERLQAEDRRANAGGPGSLHLPRDTGTSRGAPDAA